MSAAISMSKKQSQRSTHSKQVRGGGFNSKGQFFVRSRTPGAQPHLITCDDNGYLHCDCKAFEFSKRGAFDRTCVHVEWAVGILENPRLRPLVGSLAYRFYIASQSDLRRKLILDMSVIWLILRNDLLKRLEVRKERSSSKIFTNKPRALCAHCSVDEARFNIFLGAKSARKEVENCHNHKQFKLGRRKPVRNFSCSSE